jgi:hypothetical protein
MVRDTSLHTLNHLLITLIVNYGVDCKFAINKKKTERYQTGLLTQPTEELHNNCASHEQTWN